MSGHQEQGSTLAGDLESAHGRGVGAAMAGMQDPALGSIRLAGSAVPGLADAAVTSATPFLRAPLLARLSHVLVLHPPAGDAHGRCATCGTPAPCPTAQVVQR
ncbi:hypothetical protein HER39_16805 [Arthrobacter deserti]|uniref:Uncharacterized protein n=1 Tax=Arthrobacter deserti TaxID=1742687 RepID=A0ABX1JSD0_9MICC|nr:hypothetical protein [Arthrobacter deserti]